jgi:UDP-N-acetylglucosamine 2-epimerase (non-hydrolysing)
MRDVTERPEAVAAGTVRLVGANERQIVAQVTRLLDDSDAYEAMQFAHNPYGDGMAAGRILDISLSWWQHNGGAAAAVKQAMHMA